MDNALWLMRAIACPRNPFVPREDNNVVVLRPLAGRPHGQGTKPCQQRSRDDRFKGQRRVRVA